MKLISCCSYLRKATVRISSTSVQWAETFHKLRFDCERIKYLWRLKSYKKAIICILKLRTWEIQNTPIPSSKFRGATALQNKVYFFLRHPVDNRPNYLYRFSFYLKLIKKIDERISVTKYHNKSIISGKLPKLMTVLFHFISQLKVNFIKKFLDIIAIQKIDQLRKWIVMSSQSTLQCTEHLVATQVHQATEKH